MLEPAPFHANLAQGPEGSRAYWLHAADGVRIRVGVFACEQARGTVLLFPGRTEYVEKYGRTAADFVARGYTVLAIDWRGQGLADRLLHNDRIGHVDHFTDFQKDVDAALHAAVTLNLPRPWHLMAHSMGGAIGLRAAMRGIAVASAVFTGPMWGIQISALMRPAAWALSWGGAKVGLGHKIAPGTKSDSYVASEPFEGNTLTTDREMFEYMRAQVLAEPSLQLGGPSLRWLNEALADCRTLAGRASPDLPCLTFVGSNERIVDTDRIRDRMAHWPGGRLELIAGGEHEVLMEGPQVRAHIADSAVALFDAARGHDGNGTAISA
ncbi:alpha/beta hydrolase [Mesobacterium sp. TK19101]|uniref:Alpha/beta hydrolase n=1 Tax=Mesobacterium hydrothermale TaxID=3111907 RepID=A0ABU6HDK0_9RHOB|nr:alpha/beta hydrolase [Mesobacterium sp. TK19101]MEC3859945.1 alpha/beta hydrolase [Mesobacterium sp. TK19101]